MYRFRFFAPLTLLLLAGCSTLFDRSTQLVQVETPGAEQAFCELKRPGFRSRDWAPMTLRITKSRGPLTITCVADGNRQIVMHIDPKLEHSYYYNAASLGIGAAYDYETDAMWKYPDEILVDFTGVPPQPMPVPEYTRLLKEHPEIGGMETFRPGVAALPSDRGTPAPELQLRPPGAQDDLQGGGLGDDAQMIDSGATVKSGTSGHADAAAPATPVMQSPATQGPAASPGLAPMSGQGNASVPVSAIPSPVPAEPPSMAPSNAPAASSAGPVLRAMPAP